MVLQELEQEEIHSNYCNRWNCHPPFQHHLPLTTASISILLFKIQAVILLRLMYLILIYVPILWHHTHAMMFTTHYQKITKLIGGPRIPTICCQSPLALSQEMRTSLLPGGHPYPLPSLLVTT